MSVSSVDQAPPVECRGLGQVLASGGQELVVLRGVDLTIQAGESLAILGPSGSGKSTLLGLMAGLDRASEGQVRLWGEELGALDEDRLARLRRGRVGFVFQSFHLFGNLTAEENIRVPLELIGFQGAHARALELLAAVGLTERGHHYPTQLSGGEMQRVALARAFGPRPRLLLADEPTGNLDSANGRQVLELLIELQAREAATLVLVTHDASVAAHAQRRIYLEAGRIQRQEDDRMDAHRAPQASGAPRT